MAQATGYICDVCEKFTIRKPTDWFILTTENGAGKLDVCTNRCLLNLARDRLKAERSPDGNGVKPPAKPVFSAKDAELTEEQKLAIVEEALANGVKVTADKHNLPWQAVAKWKTDLGRVIEDLVLTFAATTIAIYFALSLLAWWAHRPLVGRDYDGWPRPAREVRRK